MHDAQGDGQQVVLADLEQLVARIALQHIVQPAAVVAALGVSGAGHDMGDLLPDQRHVAHRLFIGLGGEQADEAHLAAGQAIGPVPLDPHIVHVRPAMDARDLVGLGHHHRAAGLDHRLELIRQHRRLVVAPQNPARGVAQHPQAGAVIE